MDHRDKRINPRKPYSGHILFAATNGFNEGRLKDFSRSGLFINSKARLSVGEVITMALPFLSWKNDKRKGQVMMAGVCKPTPQLTSRINVSTTEKKVK